MPTYEDAFYYLHRERQLPDNVLPEDSKLKDPEERARIAKVFERGLDVPRGYALPVQRWQSKAWISERWSFRQKRMFLIPGDSPIGFRLPLDALPWLPPSRYPTLIPYDPMAVDIRSAKPLPLFDGQRQPFLGRVDHHDAGGIGAALHQLAQDLLGFHVRRSIFRGQRAPKDLPLVTRRAIHLHRHQTVCRLLHGPIEPTGPV